MWCNIMLDSSFLRIAFQNFPESLSAHGLAGTVGKKDFCLILFYKLLSGLAQIFLHCDLAYIADRNNSLLVFIPAYHISKLQVNILHAQAQQLTDTHSSSIKKLQHGTVPDSLGSCSVRLFQKPVYFIYR